MISTRLKCFSHVPRCASKTLASSRSYARKTAIAASDDGTPKPSKKGKTYTRKKYDELPDKITLPSGEEAKPLGDWRGTFNLPKQAEVLTTVSDTVVESKRLNFS